MTKIDIEAILSRANAATDGPWESYSALCCPDMGGVTSSKGGVVNACVSRYGHPMTIEDAEFVAQARTDIVDLANKVLELEQVSGELCDKCGWAMKFPGEPCRCEFVDELKSKSKALDYFQNALQDIAESDCQYGDGCPAFGARHGECFSCKARKALEKFNVKLRYED